MKSNLVRVLISWDDSRAEGRTGSSIWTDGDTIFSYGTAILTGRAFAGLVLNVTKYSATTSTFQNALAKHLHSERRQFMTVDGMERGLAASTLAAMLTATTGVHGSADVDAEQICKFIPSQYHTPAVLRAVADYIETRSAK